MKKLLILPILMFGLTGCDEPAGECKNESFASRIANPWNAWANHGCNMMTKVVQIEGHKYIILCGSYAGTIIHAESCDCRK